MPSRIDTFGDVQQLTLDEPRGNALGTQTIAAIHRALDDVQRADPHALVLTGRDRVFGVGLDLVEAAGFDRAQLAAYVDAFEDMFLRMLEFPVPLVGAVNGHALAGGAVMLLACDVRVGLDPSKGATTIALNEVELGIPFPSAALEIGRFGLPSSSHTRALAFGARVDMDGALALGFVQEKHADPVARAKEIALDVAKQGKLAVRAVRTELRREHVARARSEAKSSRARFVDAWMAPDAQARIRAVVEKLTARARS